MWLGKILFWTLKGLDVSTVLKLGHREGREGLVLYCEWEFSKRGQVIWYPTLCRDLKAKISWQFSQTKVSRLWGIELWLSLQLWVHAAVCGSRTEQRRTVLLHSFKSVQTVRAVINPQATMLSSAMARDETWKMESRAHFLLFPGRKSLCMGSVSHWHTLD